MQSSLGHLQINVQPNNLGFYKDLFAFLGWQSIGADDSYVAVADSNKTSLWFIGNVKDVAYDYDGPGVNHVAISVGAQSNVDEAAQYLAERGIQHLFETPRHRPDFSGDGPDTYYQVMFESPDRILFEIVYIGPKAA
jgi:catechol 2,3-dioxygenase-like lactoylglutathione lyase family enzyme